MDNYFGDFYPRFRQLRYKKTADNPLTIRIIGCFKVCENVVWKCYFEIFLIFLFNSFGL